MRHNLRRGFIVLAVVLAIGATLAACGGSDDGKDYTAGPIACGGLGTKNYKYIGHIEEEVKALEGTPAPGSTEQEHTALLVTWDTQGSVEGGSSLSDYSVDQLVSAAVGSTTGRTESILLGGGEGFISTGQGGWQSSGSKAPPLPHLPSAICVSLSPDIDTSKLSNPTDETINGVDSLKFTFQDLPTTFLARDADFGGGSDAAANINQVSGSVWLAKKGEMPTKIDIVADGQYPNGQGIIVRMQFELKEVGTDIKVQAPV